MVIHRTHVIVKILKVLLNMFTVCRQLPAIVALLKGKTQFSFGEFRQRNLLTLFSYVLGILELLAPGIFHREHGALHDILEEYFSMLQVDRISPVLTL